MAAYPDLISEAIAIICTARDRLPSDDPRRAHCREALSALSASINEMLYPTNEYGEIVLDYNTEFWNDMGL